MTGTVPSALDILTQDPYNSSTVGTINTPFYRQETEPQRYQVIANCGTNFMSLFKDLNKESDQ